MPDPNEQNRPPVLIHPSLIALPGKETSSYMVAIVASVAPVAMLFVIVLGLIFVREPEVRAALIQALLYIVLPGIAVSGGAAWKFIDRRGDVSVAKVQASADVMVEQLKEAGKNWPDERG